MAQIIEKHCPRCKRLAKGLAIVGAGPYIGTVVIVPCGHRVIRHPLEIPKSEFPVKKKLFS